MKTKLIIFDLDGTLVDSFKDVFNAVNESLAEFNLPPKDREWVRLLIGPNANELIEAAVVGTDVSVDDYRTAFRTHYRSQLTKNTDLFDGMKDVLEWIKEKNIKMAVLTNKSEGASLEILTEIKILDLFIKVVGYDTYPEAKPSPLGLLNLCELAGVSAAEAVLIGDTEVDIAAAKNAKAPVIAITHGYRTLEELKKEAPEYIATSTDELKQILGSLI
jgi:phosphoglycolate phosphatase